MKSFLKLKHVSSNKIKENAEYDETLGNHSSEIKFVNKVKEKIDTEKMKIQNEFSDYFKTEGNEKTIWFEKIDKPRPEVTISTVGSPYELEACAGDLYRYILSPLRAAKSRVLVTDANNSENPGYLAILSEKNPAGFTGKTLHDWNYLDGEMLRAGYLEFFFAQQVLDEGDTQINNYGLNKDKLASRIDYGWTLRKTKRKFFDKTYMAMMPEMSFPVLLAWSDKLFRISRFKEYPVFFTPPEEMKAVKNRFFRSITKIIILDSFIIDKIVSPHNLTDEKKDSIISDLNKKINDLLQALSLPELYKGYEPLHKDYQTFLENFSVKDLQKEMDVLFYYYKKNYPDVFTQIMQTLSDNLTRAQLVINKKDCGLDIANDTLSC